MRDGLTGGGPYEAFILFAAGKDNPYHNHSASIPSLIVQGTFYPVVDGQPTEYPTGWHCHGHG